jgi:hypothetical protein
MIYFIIIFQLILNIVTANSLYSIELIKFSNLETVINDGLILQIIDFKDVINYEFGGINELRFEELIKEVIMINIPNTEIFVSFHYLNYDQTYCAINRCNSVQFKIENNNPIIKLEYEFFYQVQING